MKKVIFQMLVSADGFVAGPKGEFGWHTVDEDFTAYVDRTLRSIDTILLGRVTYQGLAQYWPSAKEPEAVLMNDLRKIVFSRTLRETTWQNSELAGNGDLSSTIRRLKQEPGKDTALFGSSTLASAFLRLGLIDECRLLVCPVILGAGKPLFVGLERRQKLRLTKTETFRSGTVCLYYAPGSD